MKYGYTKQSAKSFEDTVASAKEALSKEGFGVLTEINVQETFRKKLAVDIDRYVILGACNPSFAYEAIKAEPEIGLLLPCNVIVYEKDDMTHVSTVVPTVMMNMVKNSAIQEIASEVEMKLCHAIDNV